VVFGGRKGPQARRRLRPGVREEQGPRSSLGGLAAQGLPAALRREGPQGPRQEASPPAPRLVRPPRRGLLAAPPPVPSFPLRGATEGGAPVRPARRQAEGKDVGRGEGRRA
jgi:hypothetical protein